MITAKKKKFNLPEYINKVRHFLTKGIWSVQLQHCSPMHRLGIQILRIVMLAYRGFVEDRVLLRGSALTYYTLMAIVPVLAMIFGVAKGFGFEKYLEKQLYRSFQNQQ